MSKVQVDEIVDKDDISSPTLSKGAIVTGVCTATTFSGNLTGNVTGTLTGTASGLAGSPDITVGAVASTNETVSKQLTSEHANVTGVTTSANSTVSKQLTSEHANITGVSTVGTLNATTITGDGSALTGLPAGFSWIDGDLF